MPLFDIIIRIYHDARSPACQIYLLSLTINFTFSFFRNIALFFTLSLYGHYFGNESSFAS